MNLSETFITTAHDEFALKAFRYHALDYLLNNERHIIARPMKDFEDLLPETVFFRLHQSHIVNLFFVKKILREDGGYALLEDGAKVPVARRRKDALMEVLRQQNLF